MLDKDRFRIDILTPQIAQLALPWSNNVPTVNVVQIDVLCLSIVELFLHLLLRSLLCVCNCWAGCRSKSGCPALFSALLSDSSSSLPRLKWDVTTTAESAFRCWNWKDSAVDRLTTSRLSNWLPICSCRERDHGYSYFDEKLFRAVCSVLKCTLSLLCRPTVIVVWNWTCMEWRRTIWEHVEFTNRSLTDVWLAEWSSIHGWDLFWSQPVENETWRIFELVIQTEWPAVVDFDYTSPL